MQLSRAQTLRGHLYYGKTEASSPKPWYVYRLYLNLIGCLLIRNKLYFIFMIGDCPHIPKILNNASTFCDSA